MLYDTNKGDGKPSFFHLKGGDRIQKEKTKDKKYPLKVTLADGTILKVPKQANFDNAFLRCHGCSLMAEYLALQYLHKHIWPINLLRWHRKYDSEDVKAKVTVKGVSKGINHYKKGSAYYDPTPTAAEIQRELLEGHVVILEQKNPIHSIFLFRDQGVSYMASYGKVKSVSIPRIVKTATTSKTYRGAVYVKRS